MSYLKDRLLSGWHLMRIIRLAFGVIFIIQAITMKDILVGLAAVFFLYQGIMNVGCCGESCVPAYDKSHKNKDVSDINFEEIK
ncbi:MAG: hypothetical protein JST82_10745 [Bacteroidetes bacterium]|nr:hypothetical protein [Bacteroidota bacterium]